uniref:GATOR2 complex protein WDR24 n=1 Tax=Ciona savignyi TaxID=51511 RepID=H2ZMN8_CIOSA
EPRHLTMEQSGNYSFSSTKRTISVNAGSAINALSLCQNNNKIVVAGRSLLKIYEIDSFNQIREAMNLHVGRKQGLNMSSSDVVWSPKEDNMIATAATNGAIVAWDLNAVGRNKQLVVLSDHRRTVTKISFHPKEPSRLLSGSQDCTMRMFDLRKKECTAIFHSKADGVRCVEFSPFHYFMFAASFDNGNVQIWDYRQKSTYLTQFLAHKGSVYTLNWHPDEEEKNKIATGGRDNMVKIWDVGSSNKQVCNIPTTTSVSAVRWRPTHRDQLATVSMMLDFSANVWDLRRRFVPFAYFEEHSDVTTGIVWKPNDPEVLFSCSKDGTLVMHAMREAIQPWLNTKTRGLDMGAGGRISLAGEHRSIHTRAQSPTGSGLPVKLPGIFSWKPGNFSMDSDWPGPAPASPTAKFSNSQFVYAAKNYILNGPEKELSFKQLCEHNASVMERIGDHNVAKVWLIIAEFYSNKILLKQKATHTSLPLQRTYSDAAPDRSNRAESENKRTATKSRTEDVHGSQNLFNGDPDSEVQSDEGRLIVEDYLTDIARGRHSEPDFYISDEDPNLWGYGTTSDAEFMSEQEWSLIGRVPIEAFEKKESSSPQSPSFTDPDSDPFIIGKKLVVKSSEWPLAFDDIRDDLTMKELRFGCFSFCICRYFHSHGDIQTAVCLLVAMSSYPTHINLPLDDAETEHWFSSYLDLLFKNQLFVQHAEVVKLSRLPNIRMLSASSTIHTNCKACQRRLPNTRSWSCDRRSDHDHHVNKPVLCFLCKSVVKTLYVYCQTCTFGGHLGCLQAWVERSKNRGIPTGRCSNHC